MLLLLVDGDLVDEHVVVVLVEDHEVVARSSRKFKQKCRRLFFFSLWQDVCVLLAWVGVADRQEGLEVSELWLLVAVNVG